MPSAINWPKPNKRRSVNGRPTRFGPYRFWIRPIILRSITVVIPKSSPKTAMIEETDTTAETNGCQPAGKDPTTQWASETKIWSKELVMRKWCSGLPPDPGRSEVQDRPTGIEQTPSPPSDGGEGRGEEARRMLLSPLLGREERKKQRPQKHQVRLLRVFSRTRVHKTGGTPVLRYRPASRRLRGRRRWSAMNAFRLNC